MYKTQVHVGKQRLTLAMRDDAADYEYDAPDVAIPHGYVVTRDWELRAIGYRDVTSPRMGTAVPVLVLVWSRELALTADGLSRPGSD